MENRIIYITEDIIATSGEATKEESLIRRISAQLIHFASTSKIEPIHVFIDTDGGNMKTALSVYDLFQAVPCPVYTYGISEVSSAGVLVYLGGDKRYAFPHTQFMCHPSTLTVSGSSLDFNATLDIVQKQGINTQNIFLERTKMGIKKFKKLHSQVHFMTTEEAHKLNIVTDILKDGFPEDLLKIRSDASFLEAAAHLQGLADLFGQMRR